MARIVAVHGIGQQFKGANILHREWWPALLDGLQRADPTFHLFGPQELVCPFYGSLFRNPEGLGTAPPPYQPSDVTAEEAALLELLWEAAAAAEPDRVVSPAELAADQPLARTPQFVQRALLYLTQSSFFTEVTQRFLIGDLKQVVAYMNDAATHQAVLQLVADQITEDTRVVIGHSLGSVVAYEAMCSKPSRVVSFITLGSPLGIRHLIFDKLTPRPSPLGVGAWPAGIAHWTNVADQGDVVALQKQLAPLFGGQVQDQVVFNGSDAHHGERYLTTHEVGQAIRLGL